MLSEMSESSHFSENSQCSDKDQSSRYTADDSFQIFLGGSCNPTTWRQKLAIPYLETNGISYYNPQVENWTPEAVNIERHAKQNAKVLFFVIDKQTRSAVSLVESAFMAGKNENLVLVIYPFEYDIISVENLQQGLSSCSETRTELMTKYQTVSKKYDNSSFLESTSLSRASVISSTSSSDSKSTTSTTTTTHASTTKTTSCIAQSKRSVIGETNQENTDAICEEYNSACETIIMNGERISQSEFQELRRSRYILQNLVTKNNIPMFTNILEALDYVANHIGKKIQPSTCEDSRGRQYAFKEESPQSLMDQISPLPKHLEVTSEYLMKDVYISLGSDDSTSLETSIIPYLNEKGLTYHYTYVNQLLNTNLNSGATIHQPQSSLKLNFLEKKNDPTTCSSALEIFERTKLEIEKELCAIKGSRVLLFVITNRCRGLSIMVLASHFMGLFRKNVVLCVQYLEEPCCVGDELLTKTAIADYNRGRVYLCDYAIKSEVPVFNTIQEAIECCRQKCQLSEDEDISSKMLLTLKLK